MTAESMIRPWRSHPPAAAALLFCALLAPPVKHVLEGSMTAQMLLQMPLLAYVGWLLRRALPKRVLSITAAWNHGGIAGLVLTSVTAALWMLPRSLDAAVALPWVAAAKYLSVPLLIGVPLAVSWPRAGFIVRGVFLLEFVATSYRVGWLYLSWPERLCSNYLLGDQQRLGEYLVLIGAVLCAAIGCKLLWGRFDSGRVYRGADA